MSGVTFAQVTKAFGSVTAVDSLSLEIVDGEFMVLLGPSGCGKSTALRMIAGLEEITSGMLSIGDRVVNHVPPRERDIAMVFQSYALYPHMTVRKNIESPLVANRSARVDAAERGQEQQHRGRGKEHHALLLHARLLALYLQCALPLLHLTFIRGHGIGIRYRLQ